MACTTGNHRIYAIISQSVGMSSFVKIYFVTSVMLLYLHCTKLHLKSQLTNNVAEWLKN